MSSRIDETIIREITDTIRSEMPDRFESITTKGPKEPVWPYLVISRDGGIDTSDFISNLQLMFDVHSLDSAEAHESGNDIIDCVKHWWNTTSLNVMDKPQVNGVDDDGDDKTGESVTTVNIVITYLSTED